VEPTETETKETLDHFVAVLQRLLEEVDSNPEQIRGAPWTLPVRRLDDVRAARQLDLVWQGPPAAA
jgi:glycine dehydrogenase subunit 2